MPEATASTQAERARRIEGLLRERLEATEVVVVDESHLHRGHAGAWGGAGHFRVTVASPRFAGLSLVAAQRLVYEAVGEMMGGEIHALSITTRGRGERKRELFVQFRRATTADAEAVLDLWKAAAEPGVTDTVDDVRRISAMERVVLLLAIVDDRIVGSVIAAFDGWRGNLYRLATHPDYRRRGLARRMVAEAESIFDQWGVKRITALVEKDRPWAVQFWRAVGYELDQRVSRYVRNGPTAGEPIGAESGGPPDAGGPSG